MSITSHFLLLILCFLTLILLLTSSLTHSTSSPSIPPFNISHFLYPISDDLVGHHQSNSQPDSPFLKDVLKEIAAKEKWNSEDVRVTNLDVKKAKIGDLQKYEFRVRFGKTEFVFKLLDQVSNWKRFEVVKNESTFEALFSEISSRAVLHSFKIQGPFHLRVRGDHQLTLILPCIHQLNNSFPGLRDILVGEGITVEVTGAEEVSLFHATDLRKKVNGSALSSLERSDFGYWPSLCRAWRPIRVVGSATVAAYRSRNPEASIKTLFSSNRTVELLPDKCYDRHIYQKWEKGSPINSLSSRIALLERVLQTFLGNNSNQNVNAVSVKVKIVASSIFRFQLELERDIHNNDTYWSTLAEWRTKPAVERVWFEVVGRVEAEVLTPLTIKKMSPFIKVDSKAWGNLMSNVSFTKFTSILVPQDALTLDVKW